MPELQEDGANPEAHRRHNQKSAAPAASASATASSPRPPLTSQAKLEELRAESVRSSAARTAEEKKAYAKSNLEATKKMFLSYCAKPSPAEPKVPDSYSIFPLLLAHHIIPQLRFAPTKSSRRCMGRHEARARGRRACVRAQESEPRAAPLFCVLCSARYHTTYTQTPTTFKVYGRGCRDTTEDATSDPFTPAPCCWLTFLTALRPRGPSRIS